MKQRCSSDQVPLLFFIDKCSQLIGFTRQCRVFGVLLVLVCDCLYISSRVPLMFIRLFDFNIIKSFVRFRSYKCEKSKVVVRLH